VLSALLWRRDRAALLVGKAGAVLGCLLGAVGAIVALFDQTSPSLRARWPLAVGELSIGLDPLSAFFLLCVFVVSGLGALYGAGYLGAYLGRRRLAAVVVLYNVLVIAMAGVVLARDAALFLLAWEAMSIASFFLVTFENDRDDVRRAGTTYLIASHLGVMLLMVLFGLMGQAAGSFGFLAMSRANLGATSVRDLCFLLALVGFGTKAGFWPVHTWLPDAHPAAPSHVSAVMSGVMIKMGIYGLLRVLTFLGPPPLWWGALVVVLGAISGVAGVVHALAQHDLKRLLAYHSVENIGIIALGIGIGLLGQHAGQVTVALLGYAGALLHVLNHGLFKGLLFQGAGSVLHATGTRDVEALGGLLRRLPATGLAFLVGSIAICGLPPLNGFVSEWLIYLGAFRGGTALSGAAGVAAVLVLPALALIGGLAAACFVKAFGVVFLGEPRTLRATEAHEAGPAMRTAMAIGAGLCLLVGLWPAGVLALVAPAASQLLGGSVRSLAPGPPPAITTMALLLIAVTAVLALVRARLLRGRSVATAPTWGCGYAHPTARMQYSATSFAAPVLAPFAAVLQIRTHGELPAGVFPAPAHYEQHVGDMAGERLLVPAWRRFLHTAGRLRVIQHGRMQLYLVYVLCTLVALVVWQLQGGIGR
jgi:hydrogenase-4 component B